MTTQALPPPPSVQPATARTVLLVVGCPRSGTTWLQLLLAQHPGVATSNETNVFAYLQPLHRRWLAEQSRPAWYRAIGLGKVLSADEFYHLCRSFATAVFDRIAASRPDATVILEKTPANIFYWELILTLFPTTRFLHVVRDPRSVVASLLAASRSEWGAPWSPASVVEATTKWCEAIAASRRLARATSLYWETTYERLHADTAAELRSILRWLDLPFDGDFPPAAVAASRLDDLRSARGRPCPPWDLTAEPAGFFRKGATDSWREELPARAVRTVEYLARELMVPLGYRPSSDGPVWKPAALIAHELLDGAERLSRRLLRRLRR